MVTSNFTSEELAHIEKFDAGQKTIREITETLVNPMSIFTSKLKPYVEKYVELKKKRQLYLVNNNRELEREVSSKISELVREALELEIRMRLEIYKTAVYSYSDRGGGNFRYADMYFTQEDFDIVIKKIGCLVNTGYYDVPTHGVPYGIDCTQFTTELIQP